MKRRLLLLGLAALAGCGTRRTAPHGAIEVVAIGPQPVLRNSSRGALAASDRVLIAAVAEGLVRYDAAGQVQPGLATRWDVSDDGLYYTFRIAPTRGLDAALVARRLREAISPTRRNPLQPVLGAVRDVVAVTPEIVEIRLLAPRPDLIRLLAQPELGLPDRALTGGGGPFLATSERHDGLLLRVGPPAGADDDPDGGPVAPPVRLRAARAASSVLRFKEARADLVLGGTFADLAVARVGLGAHPGLRFDPALGLFGFAIARRGGPLDDPALRTALSATLDRAAIVASFGADAWRPSQTILPATTTELVTRTMPSWSAIDLPMRVAAGRATVARQERPVAVSIALPAGPGANQLFALVAAAWRRIGVTATRVAPDAPADLRLIDEVAPSDSATWYLRRFTCARSPVCDPAADRLLDAARASPSLPARSRLLASAEARLAALAPYIPIAAPLRWSLVAPSLDLYRDNVRGAHPLDALRTGGS